MTNKGIAAYVESNVKLGHAPANTTIGAALAAAAKGGK